MKTARGPAQASCPLVSITFGRKAKHFCLEHVINDNAQYVLIDAPLVCNKCRLNKVIENSELELN